MTPGPQRSRGVSSSSAKDEVGEAVGRGVAVVLARLEESIASASAERTRVEQSRTGREQELREARERMRDLGRDLDELVNTVHRDEMARTQQKMRIEQLEERALEELGLDADGLVADYGPDQLVPFSGEVADGEETPEPAPYDREEQTKRLRTPSARWRSWAGSTRSRSRSSRRSRSGTSSSPSSSRTSRAPGATCSTSSARSTSAWSRSSPRRTPT